MGAQDRGADLQGLAQRLEALERENAELRSKIATLEGSGTHWDEVAKRRGSDRPPTEDGEPASEWSGSDGQVSRRWLLSRAGAAAAGLVVAGALTQRDIREARAAAPLVNTTNTADRGAI